MGRTCGTETESFTRSTQRIPGSCQAALSALAWVESPGGGGAAPERRLVAGGLDGCLTEWDTSTLQPRAVTDSCGGAVWALATQPGPVAAGRGPPPLAPLLPHVVATHVKSLCCPPHTPTHPGRWVDRMLTGCLAQEGIVDSLKEASAAMEVFGMGVSRADAPCRCLPRRRVPAAGGGVRRRRAAPVWR